MYDAAVDKNNLFCLCQQTNVRRDELYEQPVLVGAQERRAVVASQPPPPTPLYLPSTGNSSVRYATVSGYPLFYKY